MTASSPSPERVPTGVDGLDTIVGGGLPRNAMYALHGGTGVGKTTLGLQFLLAGERAGEPGLHVTLSETTAELEDVARSHGWSTESLRIFEPPSVAKAMETSAQTMFPPAEVELEEITKPLFSEIERIDPWRIVIDSISEIRLLARDTLRYRRELVALKRYFASRGCTVLLIHGLEDDPGFPLLQTLAHGVITLVKEGELFGPPRGRLAVDKLRGTRFREGFHDYRLDTGGLEVFPRLRADGPKLEFHSEPITSRIDGLDSLFGGGVDLGTSTLFLGPAGSGKSTLSSLYAASAAAQGKHVAMYLFGERVDVLVERSSSLGTDLRGHIRAGRVSVAPVDPAEVSPGELSERVRRSVEEQGARLIILDSLNGYLQSSRDDAYLSLHLHELLRYLSYRNVATILVLAQRGLVGTLSEIPIDVSYLADAVVLLRYFEAAGQVRLAVSMLKKRTGSHERAIRELRLGSRGVRVGPSLEAFQGVLTGSPEYKGPGASLLGEDVEVGQDGDGD